MHLEEFRKIVAFNDSIARDASIPTANGSAFRKTTHYVTGALNQLINGQLLEPRFEKEVGVRSINNAKLGEGIDFLLSEIRVLCDTTSGIQAGAGVKGAAWKSEAPAVLKNGELAIVQGTVLVNEPITTVHNFKGVSTGTADDFYPISPVKIRGNARFEVNLTLAGAAASDQLVRVEMSGIEMVSFGQA